MLRNGSAAHALLKFRETPGHGSTGSEAPTQVWCEARVECGAQATCETEAEGCARAQPEAEADGSAKALLETEADSGTQVRLEAEGRDGKGDVPWFAETTRKRSGPRMEERPAGRDRRLEAKRKRSDGCGTDRTEKFASSKASKFRPPAGRRKRAAEAGNRSSPSG